MPTTQADATRRPPMESLLRDLPEPHREILVATYFRRRTPQEAAKALGLPQAEVRARLYEAMRTLSAVVSRAQ
ncbi:sigma factor-like helix-turn-helix DNA-binding protein [Paractinoplanes atraurantiacus]|uniref:RNA polymerase sigma-70 factor, ECF subfamily n=1 Tax=Paractinoplanes atraurantiacus TaxID=1036182 RepID=A0A285HT78_9ACTN|nr:sigma factor-like helix-turn-helix DNA-binding protein [Actinoplanes atraurantiacus]SNY38924.1 RNA polymerase sigma-70 factor, ECF subfamily [Actinoplanes atraurantiacus]